eukprot:CAMPEP_0202692716 /NCGR_PEP_ID=MMETSP1385-20130828/7020_1 /ASSEMBLY_ACC=CAM_ASM_000861 /TAXON_ID=933848 /ORGANISM="Elphidium margaritaceum" /LENGTH=459 /DNA_ID=CAMNT_0049348297 /DNA_START=104 /DNA_END=1483 /DNA_ORIENTATION=+
MNSFAVNVTDDGKVDYDPLIRSLSDDDEDDVDNDDEQQQEKKELSPRCNSCRPKCADDDEHAHEEACSVSLEAVAMDVDVDDDIEDTQEERHHFVLDSDKRVAELLRGHGYWALKKLCCTDQGSVWRAKAPKKLDFRSVVIKIASKLHYKASNSDLLAAAATHNSNPSDSEHENILREIALLQRINSEQQECVSDVIKNCIITVLDTFENDDSYVVVLEDGGIDLYHFIRHCHQQIASQKIAIAEWRKTVQLIAQRLSQLLVWLHSSMHVCHLDISLENVLISNVSWIRYPDQYKNYKKKLSDDFQLKLIDFGAARQFTAVTSDDDEDDDYEDISFACRSVTGKSQYCSPQIFALQNKEALHSHFDARKADVWSFGVMLFIMAIGCPPFKAPDEHNNKLYQTVVLERNLDFVLKSWNRSTYIEESMKDLLRKIFIADEEDRMSSEELRNHPWLRKKIVQ